MNKIGFALRNLKRNLKRTLFCSAMIVAGFMAIVLFRGFSDAIVDSLVEIATKIQFTHIQVGTKISWAGTPVDQAIERLIPQSLELKTQIEKDPLVEKVVPRLSFFGLLANADNSVAAQGVAIDVFAEKDLVDGLAFDTGKALAADSTRSIVVANGLASKLQLKTGDEVTVIANTVDGAVNAVDVDIAGIFSTGLKELDEWTFYIPIKTAQKLMDTDRVERFGIYLHNLNDVKKGVKSIQKILPKDLELRTWRQLALLFTQTELFFQAQNFILASIIFTLVFLSIVNVLGQAVVERTGEIGTMRALGETKLDVVKLFLAEGALMAIFSCAFAAVISVLLIRFLDSMYFPITIPGTSKPLDLGFHVVPSAFFEAAALSLTTSVIATYIPARRAARMPVTDALRQNLE